MLQPRTRSRFRFPLVLGVVLLLRAAIACATPTPITHGTLELVSDKQWIQSGHSFDLALRFELENGWHIYWVNPGDSGEPPRVEWQLPKGISAGAIEWPTPRRLGSESVVDYGYESSVLLIVPMHSETTLAAQPSTQLSAHVKLLVCSHEMCIPGKADLSIALPVKTAAAPEQDGMRQLFAAAHASLPRPAQEWKFTVVDAKDAFVIDATRVHQADHSDHANPRPGLTQKVTREATQANFFPLEELQIDNAAEQKLTLTGLGFRLAVQKSNQLQKPVDRLKGVLAIGDQGYLVDAPVRRSGEQKPGGTKTGAAVK